MEAPQSRGHTCRAWLTHCQEQHGMVPHFAAEKSNQKGGRQKAGPAEVKNNSWGQCNTEERGSTRAPNWKGKILKQLDSKN